MQLPILPDPDNKHEMWLVVQLVLALARANIEVFILLLLLLVLYVITRLVIEVSIYLFKLYKVRAFAPSPQRETFRYLLIGGLLFGAMGVYLFFSPEQRQSGFTLLCYTFTVFSLASAGLDWYVSRQEEAQQEITALDSLTAEDVIAWQNEVNEAYTSGLMTRP